MAIITKCDHCEQEIGAPGEHETVPFQVVINPSGLHAAVLGRVYEQRELFYCSPKCLVEAHGDAHEPKLAGPPPAPAQNQSE